MQLLYIIDYLMVETYLDLSHYIFWYQLEVKALARPDELELVGNISRFSARLLPSIRTQDMFFLPKKRQYIGVMFVPLFCLTVEETAINNNNK